MSSSSHIQRVIEIKPIHHKENTEYEFKAHLQSQESLVIEMRQKSAQELQAARKQAEELLERTEAEIQSSKRRWEKEREQLTEDAMKRGYEEGYKKGMEQGLEEYQAKLVQANEIVHSAHDSYQFTVTSSEEAIVEIALKSAEKIMNQHLDHSPGNFLPLVKKVIKEVQAQSEITIFVHPDQFSYLISQREELQRVTDIHIQINIYSKEDLPPYSCIVETAFGRVDASIDSQLKELRQKLFEMIDEGKANE